MSREDVEGQRVRRGIYMAGERGTGASIVTRSHGIPCRRSWSLEKLQSGDTCKCGNRPLDCARGVLLFFDPSFDFAGIPNSEQSRGSHLECIRNRH